MTKFSRNHLVTILVLTATIGSLMAIRYFSRKILAREPAATLSVFEPHAGGCAWTRIEPVRNIEDALATFHSDCDGVRAAWAPSLDKAIVWFGTDQDNVTVYLTNLDEKTPSELPLPGDSDVVSFALASRNLPLAFTMTMEPVVGHDETGTFIEAAGARYPVLAEGDGIDVLAHAFSLHSGKWTLLETAASRCCADAAPGITLLNSYKQNVESAQAATLQSGEILSATPEHTPMMDPPIVGKLNSDLSNEFDRSTGFWGRIGGAGELEVFVWFIPAGEDETGVDYATGHARFYSKQTGEVSPLPQAVLSAKDQATYQIHDRYLLVTEAGSGMQPRLYDMEKGTMIWSSDLAQGVTFWPLIAN